jgi:hypothetical protein
MSRRFASVVADAGCRTRSHATSPVGFAGCLARGLIVALVPGFLPGTLDAQGQSIFADGFESGDTGAWSQTILPPCSRSCGPVELCDVAHLGFDDDCNGAVDEGCSCIPGTAQACFRGDPSYYGTPNCFPGVQHCTAAESWGTCVGGVDALDACFSVDLTACHAISSRSFVPVDLADGLGDFGADAQSQSWEIGCPDPFAACPVPASQSIFHSVTDGEHPVLYTKQTVLGQEQCTYSLFAGGTGALRVELHWENDLGGTGVDLDLHLHEPGDTSPWGGTQGSASDCAWDNCTAAAFPVGMLPDWFNGTEPPLPVAWDLDPLFQNNSCYFAPEGQGNAWQAIGLGCHNPRLDVDQTSCDPSVTDPDVAGFCAGEVTSIDYMPQLTWTRIAVHYYSAGGQSYDVHPAVKVFCAGKLAADLGPGGYSVPEAPVTFTPADAGTRYWLVADVAFGRDVYGTPRCLVQPLYANAADRTPLLTTVSAVTGSFGPPYPASPGFGPPSCPE